MVEIGPNPAVVPNCETGGIGIIHSLARSGVPIVTVERDWPPAFGRWSRYPVHRVTYRPWRGETLIEALLRLRGRFQGRGVLFPSSDADLAALIEHRDRLEADYQIPAAPHLGLQVFEKNWQYELAERIGVPVPRHVRFVAGEFPNWSELRFPVVIKPSARAGAAKAKTFRLKVCSEARQLEQTLRALAEEHEGREFQISESIPGEPTQLVTVGAYSDREGRVLRCFVGRKVTQFPYQYGEASVAEALPEIPEVVESARRLLEAARFHGISQTEFKYDERDRQYKLIEINPRSWSWIKLAARAGVNLPLIQYYDLTGDPRLPELLARPQEEDWFFVYYLYVRRNRLPSERQKIADLSRRKKLVAAIDDDGERWLSAVHRAVSLPKLLRRTRASIAAPA
jgi:predicted ATP-grasp superfamily ATP-dependent carboligase